MNVKVNYYILKIKQYNNIISNDSNKIVNFLWCPSHIGILGNEAADILAKSFTVNKPTKNFVIPFTDLSADFKKVSYINTNSSCLELASRKGTEYFKLCHNNSSKPWFHNSNLNRNTIVSINRHRFDQ